MTTSAPVTGGQLVYISGNNTVAPTSSASTLAFGVAAMDDAVGGNVITVWRSGICQLAASGAIAAGAAVIPATGGAVATIGADTTYDQVCGQAVSAASGGLVLVSLRPL
ncbi:capsid cement protein [Nocardia niigatensis]|uniref:capsid cement protein n=1 Tax=Nocardia niigatensis TaxID=209249 RepID=UPI000310F72A|nr:capsid cement protein [Nocardia niigatensis]